MEFGLLNVYKPSGPTSHDLVAAVRRGTGERRIGHAGTLDPLAEGVLVLALGKATRLTEYLLDSTKQYRARIELGVETDTYDQEGQICAEQPLPTDLSVGDIEIVLDRFRGGYDQVPPVYSSVKVRGRTAHSRARAGEAVKLDPRHVALAQLDLIDFEPPFLDLDVVCSAGTYIRSLAHDIGEALGCGAVLDHLVRTRSGQFAAEDAVRWKQLEAGFEDGTWREFLLPADLALPNAPRVVLDEAGLNAIRHGQAIPARQPQSGLGCAYAPDGQFVAVLSADPSAGLWRPVKVFI